MKAAAIPFASHSGADFKRDKDGRIVSTALDNVRLALAKLKVSAAYDAFARDVRVNGAHFDDVALDRLWVSIDDAFAFRPSKELLQTMVTTEAHDCHEHPVRAYLDGLVWDQRPRVNNWLTAYAGAASTDYVRAVSALVLVAAVRRVRQPGCKFDELLILEAAQGMRKSSALRALCPVDDWFSDDLPLGVDSKQIIERTTGRWIIEAAELHGNRGREAEALKAFLSRQVDGPVRLAYARMPTSVPRQFTIIGTTNSMLAYLKDPTGARRFWPVRVEGFDLDALAADRDQLWAEAAHREAAGESIRLGGSLWGAAATEQEARRASDPWEPIIDRLLDNDDGIVAVGDIWAALKLEANHLDNRHADRVAAIMQRAGYTAKKRVRIAGQPTQAWVRE